MFPAVDLALDARHPAKRDTALACLLARKQLLLRRAQEAAEQVSLPVVPTDTTANAPEQGDAVDTAHWQERIQSLEARLAAMQKQKHELFLTLKQVLHHDEVRRRQRQEAALSAPSTVTHVPAAAAASAAVPSNEHWSTSEYRPFSHVAPAEQDRLY